MTRWTLPLVALIVCGCAGSPAEPPVVEAPEPALVDEPQEWDRELPAGVRVGQATGDLPYWLPFRVRDAATGEPIEGARIESWWEASWPGAEDWESLRVQSGTTDGEGLALLQVLIGSRLYVEAPGYATTSMNAAGETDHELEPGEDLTVEVRDWLDRPRPGVTVEWMQGCGHTQSIREEITDERGRLTLRSIAPHDGFAWLRGEGLEGDSPGYGGLVRTPTIDGAEIYRAMPSPVIEGRVFDHRGDPATQTYVGTRNRHRGPWTRTDDEGRFRLVGAPAWEVLTAERLHGDRCARRLFQTVPGTQRTLWLPAPTDDPPKSPMDPVVVARGPCPLEVSFGADDLPEATGGTRIVAVREKDGLAFIQTAAYEAGRGTATVHLHPGEWQVTVGTPAGAFAPTTQTVTLAEGATSTAAFALAANPTWTPSVLQLAEDGSTAPVTAGSATALFVITETGHEPATPGNTPGSVHVPGAGPFVVGCLLDERHEGRVVLDQVPADAGPPIVLPYVPPEQPWKPTPTQEPSDAEPATLTVLLPDGTPASGASVYGIRDDLDGDGRLDLALAPGEQQQIEIRYYGDLEVEPLVTTLTGPGPWTLQWPRTLVVIVAVDESGAPLPSFDVTLSGDDEETGFDGVLSLWRTTTGPLRFWITADDRRSHDVRILVEEGRTHTVRVVLRPDPRGETEPDDD